MKRFAVPAVGIGVAAILAAALYGNGTGVTGIGLGLAGGALSAAVLAWTVRLMAATSRAAKPSFGVLLGLLLVAAKLPLLIFLAAWTRRIGPAAFDCFLAGVILVYFAVVSGAAMGGSEDETPASNGPSAR